MTAPNIEEIVNQRVESIVQNITIKMEQQTTLLIEIFQKTIENLVQYLVSVFHQTDLKKSPNRKCQMINFVPPTNNPMQWDAGGIIKTVFAVFLFREFPVVLMYLLIFLLFFAPS
ncbi:hypothetical protein CDAR_123561 [Caerostris darwini]|uniref:Uncharacterized protein n=1 Tax=Caerostris darwini TaxID=1538125 RepID=A0AAV4WTM8_9ARAC|nr:hypothetical protein CDAR_123561 [Caerostris darwini]